MPFAQSESTLFSESQHPAQVAKACQYLVQQDARSSTTASVARAVLRDHHPAIWETTGIYVPQALHEWARNRIRYIREPGVEYVASLEHTVRHGAGDCDDLAVAIATIALGIGFPTWIAWRWTAPNMAHVYCVLGGTSLAAGAEEPVWRVDPFLPGLTRDLGNDVKLLRCRPTQSRHGR